MNAAGHRTSSVRTSGMLLVFVLALAAASCGDSSSDRSNGAGKGTGGGNGAGEVDGTVTVFAAASLTEPFTVLGRRFEGQHPGTRVKFNFGASSELVQQVGQGAPADVLATADTSTMDRAVRAGQAGHPTVFAGNRMTLLVGKGNPKGIKDVAGLAEPGVVFVLCAPEVPCGKLGAQVLDKASVTAKPKSFEDNVKGVLSRVALGEADAGIGYVSDARAAKGKVGRVDIPARQNVTTSYPVAVLSETRNRATARAFVASVRSGAGQAVLTADGFLPPP